MSELAYLSRFNLHNNIYIPIKKERPEFVKIVSKNVCVRKMSGNDGTFSGLMVLDNSGHLLNTSELSGICPESVPKHARLWTFSEFC